MLSCAVTDVGLADRMGTTGESNAEINTSMTNSLVFGATKKKIRLRLMERADDLTDWL